MKEIDYALYLAHFLRELPRVSVPGVGSFIRVPQKSVIDPRTGEITPPFYVIKYEPGSKYLYSTLKFMQDTYNLSLEEAEAFVKEMGRYVASYLKMPVELELPRVGKLRRIGGTYKLELFDDPFSRWAVDLEVAKLRSKTTTTVPVTTQEKPQKQEKPSKPLPSRASSEQLVDEVLSKSPKKRKLFLPIVIGVVGALGIVGALVYFLGRKESTPQIVEINLSKRTPSKDTTAATPPAKEPEKPSKQPVSPQALRERGRVAAQEPKPTPPSPSAISYKYHIIGAAAPSQAEAKQKAQEFEKKGLSTQLLSHPSKPGWYRISIYQSNSLEAANQKLKELRGTYPDAWLYK